MNDPRDLMFQSIDSSYNITEFFSVYFRR